LLQRSLNELQIGDALPHLCQLLLGNGPGFLALGAVVEFEQEGDLVQAEAQPLGRFDEAQAIERRQAIASNPAGRPIRLGQQAAPLVIAHGLDIDSGRPGQPPDGQLQFLPAHGLDSVLGYGIKVTPPLRFLEECAMRERNTPAGLLIAGGLAALLGSACCLGPLVLVSVGLGGAWLSQLEIFEPLRPYLLGTAVILLFLAYRRIWRPVGQCAPGQVCALPRNRHAYKLIFGLAALLLLAALASPYLAPLFY